MSRKDGKSRDAEMRRNDTNRNPAGTGGKRFQAADAAGASSAQSRSSKSGAQHNSSSSANRGGSAPSGSASRSADERGDHPG